MYVVNVNNDQPLTQHEIELEWLICPNLLKSNMNCA